jgi:predicted alpha/beta superfamily hydrolase
MGPPRSQLGRAVLSAALLGLAACAQPLAQRGPTAQPNVQVLAERLPMPGLDRERTLRLYLPPNYATRLDRRYPVIYMHDAQNLFDDASAPFGAWHVGEALDELARSKGFEAIVVGIDHGDDKRVQEMLPFPAAEGEAYIGFVVEVVKPFIDSHYRTRPQAAATAIAGASLGAVISQVALHRHPEVFGRAMLLSPAYWIAPPIAALARDLP